MLFVLLFCVIGFSNAFASQAYDKVNSFIATGVLLMDTEGLTLELNIPSEHCDSALIPLIPWVTLVGDIFLVTITKILTFEPFLIYI